MSYDPNETCKFLHDIYTGTFFIEGFIPNYAHALAKDVYAIFHIYFQSALFKEIAISKHILML
jgi:cytoskeletal protein RodZ